MFYLDILSLFKNMRLSILIAAIALLLSCYALANSVDAYIDQSEAVVGDSVRLSIRVEGDIDETIDLPKVKGLSVSGSGTSTSVSIVNGKMTRTATYQYYLHPQNVGAYIIPKIKVKVAGKELFTEPLTLVVKDAESFIQGQDDFPAVFVKRSFSKKEVYLGEPFISSVKLYYRSKISGANAIPNKSEDFRYIDFEQETKKERVGQYLYHVIEAKRVLIPLRSGSIAIDPYQIRVGVVQERSRKSQRRGVDSFFGFFDDMSQQVVTKNIASKADTILVKSVPQSDRPASYSGLVGRFDAKASLSADHLQVGETSTLTITIQGVGVLDTMKNIDLKLPDSLKIYADKPELIEKSDKKYGVVSKRVFRYALVPTKQGRIDLGFLKQSYFDPRTQRFEEFNVQLNHLEVAPGKEEDIMASSLVKPNSSQRKETVKSLGKDLIDVHRNIKVDKQYSYFGDAVKLFALVSFLLYLLVVILDRFKEHNVSGVVKRRRSQAYKVYKSEKKSLEDDLSGKRDVVQVVHNLYQAYRKYLGDKLNLKGAALTIKDIDSQLLKIGLEKEHIIRAHNLAKKIDRIVFSHMHLSSAETKNIMDDIDQLIGEIERKC